MASSTATTSVRLTGAGTPISAPTPAMPENSLEQRADAGDDQGSGRKPGPEAPVALEDQPGVALAGRRAEPHRQLLHDVEDRDQQELQRQQAVAPLRAALGGGDDAAGVGVGQHHDQAGPGHDEETAPAEWWKPSPRPPSCFALSFGENPPIRQ